MGEKSRHMGMDLTEQRHEQWHSEHEDVNPEQHETMMEKMGISEEEDAKWHAANSGSTKSVDKAGENSVNPFAVGGGFLAYCVQQGWLREVGKGRHKKYYATDEGRIELAKFGIEV